MTKRMIAMVVMLLTLLALTGCSYDRDHDHDWEAADCTTPKTCNECGKTKGDALGHDWADANCSTPKTCVSCGKTKGSALGHDWTSGSCTSPTYCTVCNETNGAAAGHDWIAATCTAPAYCTSCYEVDGTAAGHNWTAATCTSPAYCTVCHETSGDVASHNWISGTTQNTKMCSMCGLTESTASVDIDIVIGDTITMGYYGYEEIEWIILDYDPSTNQALLISKYCLDAIPYHAGSTYGSWENSTLRKWLNNTFINTAFSQDERDAIVTKLITNPDNPDFDVDGGNDTYDRIFLLSYEEAVYYFPSQTSRKCQPTAYCLEQGCYDPVKYAEKTNTVCEPEAVGHTWWWLRTPGKDSDHACNVLAKGIASSHGGNQTSNEGTIRPAMWIQLG